MTRVSVAIGAQDEADRLPRALASVGWADEIVVVDCGSRDDTVRVADDAGAIVERMDEWPGDGPQKRAAFARTTAPWVLMLDADEEVSPELAAEIRRVLANEPRVDGYTIPFHSLYYGHWFGRRGWYRERHLRLVRRDAVTISGETIHAQPTVAGGVAAMRHPIRHYSDRDLSHHVAKLQRYAAIKAARLRQRGRRAGLGQAFAYACGAFAAEYLRRGRFLDGAAGLAYSGVAAHATLQAYVRLWELEQRGPATS